MWRHSSVCPSKQYATPSSVEVMAPELDPYPIVRTPVSSSRGDTFVSGDARLESALNNIVEQTAESQGTVSFASLFPTDYSGE